MDKTYHLVVDADSILYTACYRNQYTQKEDVLSDGKPIRIEYEKCNLELAYMDFVAKIVRMKSMIYGKYMDQHHSGRLWRGKPVIEGLNIKFTIVFSPKKTFRNDLTETYKANRRKCNNCGKKDYLCDCGNYEQIPNPIVGIPELKAMVSQRLGHEQHKNCEADDVVIWYARFGKNVTLGCIDKDIYDHSPVECITYDNWEWKPALEDKEIEDNYWVQALLGDSGDGIKGCPKVGKGGAQKLVYNLLDEFDYDKYVETYEENGSTEEDAILNMRLVRMDQLDINQQIKLWREDESNH